MLTCTSYLCIKAQHMKKLSMEELGRLSAEEYKKVEKMPVVVVLDNIRSQNNTGSVFRTSDAFRVEAIHLCGITATPPHREIQKTALGATDSVDWKYFETSAESIAYLKKEGYHILVVEQAEGSVSLFDYHFPIQRKTAIIFGNEVNGVQQEIVDMADECLEIPQKGTKHSLNVSVSAGIVLWSVFRSMNWK